MSGLVSPTMGWAAAVTVSWTRRWSCRSGVRHTSPAWVNRSTIAEVAGGLVPRAWANSVRVTGASALIRCSTVSWASVSPRPAQTTVLAATRPRRWVTSQRTSCAVTLFAGWPPVARWLLDRACGWRPGRTQQIQPPMQVPTNAGFVGASITIAQVSGTIASKGPGGSYPSRPVHRST